ncbi:hypothetical protein Tco_0270014 [Tanacetum coccineum]
MAALVSFPKHNTVACLEKTEWNAQFHEIVDFLTRSSIYYSLTISPTVSTSLIEQFWNTATSKTVNDVSYIKAKVAGKTISISEASVRQDLLFHDVDGIDCHVTPLFPNMLAQAVIDEGEGSGQPTEPQPTPSLTQPSIGDQPPVTESSYRPNATQDPIVNLEGTGGSQMDQVLHNTCTLLSQRVLDLQQAKDAKATEIIKLKTRIKKLKNKCKPSISHHRAWLRSVSRLSRTKQLGKKESVSKQGRKNAKPGPTLDAFDDLDANLSHGMDYMEIEEVVNEGRQSNETEELNLDVDTEVIVEDKGSGEKGGSTISTARPKVDTTRPEVDTARPDIDTANAPDSIVGVTISTADPEVSVVEPRTPPTTTNVEDSSRPVRSITTLKPLPSIDPKDKGKGILVEEEPVKIMRKDPGIYQIERDEELAHKLHEEE